MATASNIKIITDSTSDLTFEQAQDLGVDIVPLYVHFQSKIFRDGIDITTKELFAGVRAGASIPSTSQPNPADFERFFEKALQEADQVLSIHISHKLSSTVQSAEIAAKNFNGRVKTLDSLTASGGLAMVVERAARLAGQNAEINQIIDAIKAARDTQSLRFCVDSLEYLRKNGRIGGAQAFLGGLLNIKPILYLQDGQVAALTRARGMNKAIAELTNEMKKYADHHGKTRAAYLFAENQEAVEPLRKIGRELNIEEFAIHDIGAVVAAHVGPGTFGFVLEAV